MNRWPHEYIGDGVYATFDGYQVWIWTSDGIRQSEKVAIEPTTLGRLNAYYKRVTTIPKVDAAS